MPPPGVEPYGWERGMLLADFEQTREKAEQGIHAAQYNLGVMFDSGIGVRENPAEAARWYLRAAEQGDKEAQSNLGVLYDTGRGVPQDFT